MWKSKKKQNNFKKVWGHGTMKDLNMVLSMIDWDEVFQEIEIEEIVDDLFLQEAIKGTAGRG
jgi:hypothetical protein